ncbi:8-oxo-dGTP pyrophosphatase MutT (NUDIX family) [Cerasibacillus quisquiliarum]|uniref:Coenzyme A pyrophosphatase n=1 Tax=Cerasibacillus quisquiliarum TaxID=227865 RepID=A0A511UYU7_9BACI|nr:CoA pyrophosphatase [Cerasibacillus quisquiliarum]MBB5146918.1 8-oxo-dGTP pyrophosphatase MutT (NUDIX family) [Cerasibacillus quisquiliarum]GEN31759.1 coenzyme A pyrophosphatase [Cerasibacillus quisquiliarum]
MNAVNIIEQLKKRKRSMIGEEQLKKSAVLIPLIEKKDGIHILFEVRSMILRSQPGDICFPGGRKDREDPSPLHCAIRETSEELGVNASDIKDVAPLDYFIPDMGRIIYPFVGRITENHKLKPNRTEVAEVFTVPLDYFLNTEPKKYKVNLQVIPEKNFPYHLITGGKDYQWRTPKIDELFYQYDNRVIWGLTARILKHFIDLIKSE